MTIYEALVAAGIPVEHHQSDLHVKVTPESTRLVREHAERDRLFIDTFRSNVDGATWYDIPFAYDPFWTDWRARR